MLKNSNAFLYIQYTITFVESIGPPCVIRYIKSNIWNEEIVVITNTKNIVGLSNGKVIQKKVFNEFAPSIFAASKTSWFMAENPDKNITRL